jgi:hypothetical protein
MLYSSNLQKLLQLAYTVYYDNANAKKCATVWSFQGWLDHSVIAKRIIEDDYEVETVKCTSKS